MWMRRRSRRVIGHCEAQGGLAEGASSAQAAGGLRCANLPYGLPILRQTSSWLRPMRRYREYGPRPSIPEPRPVLLTAVRAFVQAASRIDGVRRIALLGSLATDKPIPKDADLLVTINPEMDLDALANAGRRLKGKAQTINLGADIFLADEEGHYLGRICGFRECHVRMLCRARHCGERNHLNDDLQVVKLPARLIAEPPLELWPSVVRRIAPPADVEAILLAPKPARQAKPGQAPQYPAPRATWRFPAFRFASCGLRLRQSALPPASRHSPLPQLVSRHEADPPHPRDRCRHRRSSARDGC